MTREPAAGLLMAKFDHHTSRDLDPQLHTHVFVFNLAPRKDGTWGAIVSRELYKAQKQAGAIYREALAADLERAGYAIERAPSTFRVAAIPRNVERAFSKRRQSIEAAAEAHGYRSPKGMELAALRTRQAKRDVSPEQLFETWRAEAKALGFELSRTQLHRSSARDAARTLLADKTSPRANAGRTLSDNRAPPALSKLADAARALDGRANMPSVAVDLLQRERVSRTSLKENDRG